MDTDSQLYNNPTRKQTIVNDLKETLAFVMSAAEVLDKKALDLFGITSGILGVVTALEVSLNNVLTDPVFWGAMVLLLVFYGVQIREVWLVIKPVDWRRVPGTEDGKLSYEALMEKYVPLDDDLYMNQLIADYAGANDSKDPKKFIPGAIEVANKNNEEKAKHIRNIVVCLGLIVITLFVMALVAAL